MHLFTLFFFLRLLLARFANAERQLPADLQVNLLFPRANETYAPTQWFPIVFGINNLDAIWPVNIHLEVTIWSMAWRVNESSVDYYGYDVLDLNDKDFIDIVGSGAPSQPFFHYPSIDFTNGSTTDEFMISWSLQFSDQCFANNTIPSLDTGGDGWSNTPVDTWRGMRFKTAPGAQLPDIEAALRSCPEPHWDTSTAIRVTEVRSTLPGGRPCPVLDTNITETCPYASVAGELAANVSSSILNKMGCESGTTWQTQTGPCQNMASSFGRGYGMGWLLVMGLVVCRVF